MNVRERLRVNNFDLLRMVFAVMVMIFHTGVLSGARELAWMERYISPTFAVQAFFFVSGFLVTMSYEKSSSLRSYGEKRLRRIAPAYAFLVISAAIFLAPLSTLPWREYFAAAELKRYVFFNLILSNFSQPSLPGVFVGHVDRAIDGSLWTIKVEVAFYCAVPILVHLSRRLGRAPTYVAVFAMSIAWRLGFAALGVKTGNPFWGKLAIQAPGQLAYFVTGAWAYYRTEEGKAAPTLWMALVGVALYVTRLFAPGLLVHELIGPFCVAAFCYWASIRVPRLVPDVNKFGDASYGMYLYHWPIIQVIVAIGVFTYSPWLAALVAWCSNTAFSYFSWHVVEKRFLRHKKIHSHAPTRSPG
jgi:peptidoglycan/LPS O-acetylase OafA/YrhL